MNNPMDNCTNVLGEMNREKIKKMEKDNLLKLYESVKENVEADDIVKRLNDKELLLKKIDELEKEQWKAAKAYIDLLEEKNKIEKLNEDAESFILEIRTEIKELKNSIKKILEPSK